MPLTDEQRDGLLATLAKYDYDAEETARAMHGLEGLQALLEVVPCFVEAADERLMARGLSPRDDADPTAPAPSQEVVQALAAYIVNAQTEGDPTLAAYARLLLGQPLGAALAGGLVGATLGIGYALALADAAGEEGA